MHNSKKINYLFLVLLLLTPFSLFFSIYSGEVDISIQNIYNAIFTNDQSPSSIIINQIRIPEALTAIIACAALAVSGLTMQSAFRNPLAGPSVMGVSSGASFGVVLFITLFSNTITGYISQQVSIILFAAAGAVFVILLLSIIQWRMKGIEILLIIGLLLSYFISSCETLLLSNTSAINIKTYVHWGFGSFSKTDFNEIAIMCAITIPLLMISLLQGRMLDAFQINNETVTNIGINKNKSLYFIIINSSLICAIVTAFCGPIAFIGLCVPHITRLVLKTNKHFYMICGCVIIGLNIGLLCLGISRLSIFSQYLPINTVTSFLGAPFIIYLLIKGYRKKIA